MYYQKDCLEIVYHHWGSY